MVATFSLVSFPGHASPCAAQTAHPFTPDGNAEGLGCKPPGPVLGIRSEAFGDALSSGWVMRKTMIPTASSESHAGTAWDDERRWAAVKQRSRAADGAFVFAVRTTGIFCRPSCPSRAPNRANVLFFGGPEHAVAAGFRACKRCHPLEEAPRVEGADAMARVATHITAHAAENLPMSTLAALAGMGVSHFQKTFRQQLGVTPRAFHAAERMRLFKASLREGADVLSAVMDAGYGSTRAVYEQVDGPLGMTPRAYRDGGKGETVFHATRRTSLGLMLLAGTARGVCLVAFADRPKELREELVREYPNATLEPSAASTSVQLDAWMEAMERHLQNHGPSPALPLDLRGTAFQRAVWTFLQSVPAGTTVTYTEVARAVGRPRAVRAVASACAANRVAVLVPCHRVLRGDGELGGYRWGMERKQALVSAERQAAAARVSG